VLATERAKQCDPQILGGVGFSAAESRHTNRAVISSDTDSLKNSLSLRRVFGQKSGGEQIVGLATAHGLLEAEDALIAPSHQPVEDLAQQNAHALGDMCFIKKGANIEVPQIGNLSDRIRVPTAEDRLPRIGKFGQRRRVNDFSHCLLVLRRSRMRSRAVGLGLSGAEGFNFLAPATLARVLMIRKSIAIPDLRTPRPGMPAQFWVFRSIYAFAISAR
jgi:hypothetical protein